MNSTQNSVMVCFEQTTHDMMTMGGPLEAGHDGCSVVLM